MGSKQVSNPFSGGVVSFAALANNNNMMNQLSSGLKGTGENIDSIRLKSMMANQDATPEQMNALAMGISQPQQQQYNAMNQLAENQKQSAIGNQQVDRQFDYTQGRDIIGDEQAAASAAYQAGRDQVGDQQWGQTFGENQRQFDLGEANKLSAADQLFARDQQKLQFKLQSDIKSATTKAERDKALAKYKHQAKLSQQKQKASLDKTAKQSLIDTALEKSSAEQAVNVLRRGPAERQEAFNEFQSDENVFYDAEIGHTNASKINNMYKAFSSDPNISAADKRAVAEMNPRQRAEYLASREGKRFQEKGTSWLPNFFGSSDFEFVDKRLK